jgi:hypothetical protein
LNADDFHWRERTLIILDNAQYHRS